MLHPTQQAPHDNLKSNQSLFVCENLWLMHDVQYTEYIQHKYSSKIRSVFHSLHICVYVCVWGKKVCLI